MHDPQSQAWKPIIDLLQTSAYRLPMSGASVVSYPFHICLLLFHTLDGRKRTPTLSVTPTQSHQTIAKTRQTPGESKTDPQKQAESTQPLLRGVVKVSEEFKDLLLVLKKPLLTKRTTVVVASERSSPLLGAKLTPFKYLLKTPVLCCFWLTSPCPFSIRCCSLKWRNCR